MPRHHSYSLSDEKVAELVFRRYGVKISPEQIARAPPRRRGRPT